MHDGKSPNWMVDVHGAERAGRRGLSRVQDKGSRPEIPRASSVFHAMLSLQAYALALVLPW